MQMHGYCIPLEVRRSEQRMGPFLLVSSLKVCSLYSLISNTWSPLHLYDLNLLIFLNLLQTASIQGDPDL